MPISVSEHAARRERVLKDLKGAVGVVFAGESPGGIQHRWKTNRFFWYLTGLDDESGAAVLFDPSAPNPDNRIILFLRPLNPEVERWDGYRDEISPALRERLAFGSILRSTSLPAFLTSAARRTKRLACLHPFSVYPAPVSPDLDAFRKVAERVPGVAIEDRTQLLASLRALKSPGELALMKRACAATKAGFDEVFGMLKPGLNEAEIQRALERGFHAQGGTGHAYHPIVAAGLRGTVMHYNANNAEVGRDDLIVIDAASEFEGYASDVTRTLPASGRFTKEQRDVYEVVLVAELAAIAAVRPGATMIEVDRAARDVIEAAGFGHTFIHSVGHQLGIDVHDVTPDGPLRAGMVVTIEPGIYLPERSFGVRIEDDILVTEKGRQNLTATIPKTVRDIETALKR